MGPENEIAELRKDVGFLSMTLKGVFAVLLALFALMNILLSLRSDAFEKIYTDMLGGAPLPLLTQAVLDYHPLIAGAAGLSAAVVIVLVFALKARWPLVLLIVVAAANVVLHSLLLYAFFMPIMVIIRMLTAY